MEENAIYDRNKIWNDFDGLRLEPKLSRDTKICWSLVLEYKKEKNYTIQDREDKTYRKDLKEYIHLLWLLRPATPNWVTQTTAIYCLTGLETGSVRSRHP
jgi:hypothetical protein